MPKRLLLSLLAVLVFFSGGFVLAYRYSHPAVIETTWEGTTDLDMLHKIEADLKAAKDARTGLRVTLRSPGGAAVLCLEMARLIRNASDAGTVVEIHGSAVVASCGTVVLAAGTPGHRYIARTTLFLVHPFQKREYGESSCLTRVANPKTEDDKILVSLFDTMYDTYARLTGRDRVTVIKWLLCGNETVGAENAVAMGLADKLE